MERIGLSVGVPASALQAASGLVWTAVGVHTSDPLSKPAPRRGELLALRVQLSAISSATAVTVQLASQADGAGGLSQRGLTAATQDITFQKSGTSTSTTAGICYWPLAKVPFTRDPDGTAGVIYVGLQLDAGQATVDKIELWWELGEIR